jgi:hypothetical protein
MGRECIFLMFESPAAMRGMADEEMYRPQKYLDFDHTCAGCGAYGGSDKCVV